MYLKYGWRWLPHSFDIEIEALELAEPSEPNRSYGAGKVGHYAAHTDPSMHILCQNGEPSNQMHQKCPRILDTSLKQRYHRHGIYKWS